MERSPLIASEMTGGVRAPDEAGRADAPDAPVPPAAPRRTAQRRRRPTGGAPPLPRHISWTARAWGIALLAVAVVTVVAIRSTTVREAINDADAAVLRFVLTYRLATYWLPIFPGWLSFVRLERHGYV